MQHNGTTAPHLAPPSRAGAAAFPPPPHRRVIARRFRPSQRLLVSLTSCAKCGSVTLRVLSYMAGRAMATVVVEPIVRREVALVEYLEIVSQMKKERAVSFRMSSRSPLSCGVSRTSFFCSLLRVSCDGCRHVPGTGLAEGMITPALSDGGRR